MNIIKVINNNIVQSKDDSGQEVLVMGCGLGFKKQVGDKIDDQKIEKIYKYEEKDYLEQLKLILSKTPLEHVQVANEIIHYAKFSLGKKLNDNIYITLTDHISFSIQRVKDGIEVSNALLWEIKRFYNHEYLVGKEALSIIKRRLGVELPEDEAGFLALHFVNASMNCMEMHQTAEMTKIIPSIVSIIKYHFQREIDEYSIHYERFLTHLKFLVNRILTGMEIVGDDTEFLHILKEQYQSEYQCALKIQEYVKKEYQKEMTEDELVYLTVHIKRITM